MNAAATRLEEAIGERALLGGRIAALNAEIPQLERTLMVLRDQTRLTPAEGGLIAPVLQPGPDLSGMGSTPAQRALSVLEEPIEPLEEA